VIKVNNLVLLLIHMWSPYTCCAFGECEN
jgi:hypothetical protein